MFKKMKKKIMSLKAYLLSAQKSDVLSHVEYNKGFYDLAQMCYNSVDKTSKNVHETTVLLSINIMI